MISMVVSQFYVPHKSLHKTGLNFCLLYGELMTCNLIQFLWGEPSTASSAWWLWRDQWSPQDTVGTIELSLAACCFSWEQQWMNRVILGHQYPGLDLVMTRTEFRGKHMVFITYPFILPAPQCGIVGNSLLPGIQWRHMGTVESCSGEGWDLTLGRVVRHWNRLPREVVNAPNPSVLRKHLNNALNDILWLVVSPEMVRNLDYMFISLPTEISYPVLSLNWITVGHLHVLCPLDAAMLRRAGREEERTPGMGHQGQHSSAFCLSALCMNTVLVDSGISSGCAWKCCRPGLWSVCVKCVSWAF